MTREEVLKSATNWFKGDDLRANVWVDKYCLRNGGEYLEKDPDDMFVRIATEFARIEMNYPKPMSYEEIYYLLEDFKYVIPGGSMLYGIGNNFSYSSLGNCFVIGDDRDSYGSICKIDEEQAQLMKRRGGVGHDLSHLRPKGTHVSNAANTSTGAASFMSRYSNTTREVGQDGRRGALMLTMNVEHPDILDFVTAKDDLTKVTGANISVKVSDAFMNSLVDEGENKKIWDTIIHQAWKNGEPGVLFWDTIINNSPADKYDEFKSISTNPCGEIPLCAYDTCRLMSVNMFSFVEKPFTADAYFDVTKFIRVVNKAQRLMDDAIDLEAEKIDRILDKIMAEDRASDVEVDLWVKIKSKLLRGRRTGLSLIGLADTLAALGIQYGSEESLAFCNLKFKLFHDCAYESSYEMAQERGSFPAFDRVHSQISHNGEVLPFENRERRNIALLTIPPSGTISMMANVSSGIEPVFNLSYTRRRKVEVSDNVAFVDKTGDKWEEYKVYHEKYRWYLNMVNYGGEAEFIDDPYIGSTANDIDPMKRVELQATIQRWIDHSISSTINLPKDATEETISAIYMKAWELGCKGITVYRDGCRDGVLINKVEEKPEFKQHSAPKRPKRLNATVNKLKINGLTSYVIVGLYEDKPYEVFIVSNKIDDIIGIPYKDGVIVKIESGRYVITNPNDKDQYPTDLIEKLTDEQKAITRLVSTALRHGTDIKFIVEQLNKTQGDLTSFSKAIARVLKQYITNGTQLKGSDCPNCGSKLVMENGCEICKSCGTTKCG